MTYATRQPRGSFNIEWLDIGSTAGGKSSSFYRRNSVIGYHVSEEEEQITLRSGWEVTVRGNTISLATRDSRRLAEGK